MSSSEFIGGFFFLRNFHFYLVVTENIVIFGNEFGKYKYNMQFYKHQIKNGKALVSFDKNTGVGEEIEVTYHKKDDGDLEIGSIKIQKKEMDKDFLQAVSDSIDEVEFQSLKDIALSQLDNMKALFQNIELNPSILS